MNDLDICKRIAEIEHGQAFIDGDDTGNFINLNHPCSDRGGEMYNPLTDDALCFRLMVKHGVTIEPSDFFVNRYFAYCKDENKNNILPKAHEENPNKAICLAIIEANKD